MNFYNSILVWKDSSSLYSDLILNLYIVYGFNDWLRNHINTFTLKSCLFGTVKLTRNADKSKFNYNGPGIAFDAKGVWSYGNDFARNAVILGVDNTSSSHTDNKKVTF